MEKQTPASFGLRSRGYVYHLLVAGLLLFPSVSARAQAVVATVPVGMNPGALAVNPVTNKIYVANCVFSSEGMWPSGTVTVIDGATNATTDVPAGVCPSAVAVNPVTNKIYVANSGRDLQSASITVIDGATNTTTTIADQHTPVLGVTAVAVNPVTNKIYVAFFEGVTVIDGAANAIITTIPAKSITIEFQHGHDMVVDPGRNKVYVSNNAKYLSNSIEVIDGATNTSTILTDHKAFGPCALALNAVSNKIYVANAGRRRSEFVSNNVGSITVIDGAQKTITNITDPNAEGPHAVAVNPVTNKIFVVNGKGGVTVIDGATNSITSVTDPNAGCPAGVAVDSGRNKAFVANSCSNNVTVIDGVTNSTVTVTDSNSVGPIAVAVNQVTNKVYVVNNGSDNVTVIDEAMSSPKVAITSVVNGASFLQGLASGAWITLNGSGLSDTTRTWTTSDFNGNQLPTQLDGVSVTVNSIPAYVYYISPTQVTVLAPDDSAPGPVPVRVTSPQGTAGIMVGKETFSPAFFQFLPTKYAAAEHGNGTYLGKPNILPGVVTTPAKPGETILLFGTGFGPTNPALPTGQLVTEAAPLANPVTIFIGGKQAKISFAGLNASGLDQFNVTVPADLPDGDQTLVASVGDAQSQPGIFITVQK